MNNKIIRHNNKIWHFYYNSAGICANILSDTSTPAVVFSDGYFDFDVICDGEDIIHLICQDKTGSVIYLTHSKNRWTKRTLLVSKTKASYIKSFKISLRGKLVYAMYTIVKEAKPMLVMHYLNTDTPPAVIDYITPSPRSFFAFSEDNGDINICYQNANSVLGFKRYIWSKKDFLAFTPLLENASCPIASGKSSVFALFENKIVRIGENGAEEIYNSFGNELSPPWCITLKGSLYIMWKQGNLLFYSKSAENGFSPPSRLLTPYASAELFEIKPTATDCKYLYGSLKNNTVSLISPAAPLGIGDFFDISEKSQPEETDKLTLILEKLDEIQKLISAKGGF